MPEPLYACTPTRLTTWRSCPRRYRMVYLDEPRPVRGPAWAHTAVGAAVHVALAAWFGLPRADRTPQAGVELLHRAWPVDGFRDAGQSAGVRDRAAGWVRAYLAGPAVPAAEPLGVERSVSVAAAGLLIGGRADRLDAAADGSVVVVDYKTGHRAPTAQDAASSLPLAVYLLGARRQLRRPGTRVELHHLPSGTVVAAEHTEATLAASMVRAGRWGAAAAAADDAHRRGLTGPGDFPARPAPSCRWCDVRRHCPPGRAASEPAEPWDGL